MIFDKHDCYKEDIQSNGGFCKIYKFIIRKGPKSFGHHGPQDGKFVFESQLVD